MKNNLKKILILGASSDIGIEATKIFLKNSWEVYAHFNKNSEGLKNIKNKNLKIFKINFLENNKKFKSVLNIFSKTKFDAFLNLAGYIDNKNFNNFTIESSLKTFQINTITPLYILQKIIGRMIKAKYGRILLTSSIGVKFGGGKNTFNYSISKMANQFIPRDYKEWAKKNILINCLIIGATNTKIHKKINNKNISSRKKLIPINRFAEPFEIVNYIFYLLSQKNSFITGQNISISGGE